MPRPYAQGEDLDRIRFGDVWSPGLCKLSRHERKKNIDVQRAKGKTGASTTLNGDDPADFDAEFTLANDETVEGPNSDFALWESFQKLIESTTNGAKPFALPIYHPDLARQRITEVMNGGVGPMIHDGKGGATVKVRFVEYLPPKPKAAAKPAAKAGARQGVTTLEKPDPNAAAKAELAALLAEAKKA